MEFNEKLQSLRRQKGITQEDLAGCFAPVRYPCIPPLFSENANLNLQNPCFALVFPALQFRVWRRSGQTPL